MLRRADAEDVKRRTLVSAAVDAYLAGATSIVTAAVAGIPWSALDDAIRWRLRRACDR